MVVAARLIYPRFTGMSRAHIDWRKSFEKCAPIGLATVLEVGLTYWGLLFATKPLFVSPTYKSLCLLGFRNE